MSDLHVMYAPTCHLDPVNSTPIWNYLAATQHMPFLCPHITGLTSYACVQKSFKITRFSFSSMLQSGVVKHSTLLKITLCSFEVCFSPLKWIFTVSLRAAFDWSECIDKNERLPVAFFFQLIFLFFSHGCTSLLHPEHGVSAAECLVAAAAADLHAFFSF